MQDVSSDNEFDTVLEVLEDYSIPDEPHPTMDCEKSLDPVAPNVDCLSIKKVVYCKEIPEHLDDMRSQEPALLLVTQDHRLDFERGDIRKRLTIGFRYENPYGGFRNAFEDLNALIGNASYGVITKQKYLRVKNSGLCDSCCYQKCPIKRYAELGDDSVEYVLGSADATFIVARDSDFYKFCMLTNHKDKARGVYGDKAVTSVIAEPIQITNALQALALSIINGYTAPSHAFIILPNAKSLKLLILSEWFEIVLDDTLIDAIPYSDLIISE